jgi:hypothetical protein
VLSASHVHVDERGLLHRCYHKCHSLLFRWQFWAGMTLGFPFEHLLWEKVPPFDMLTKLLGL